MTSPRQPKEDQVNKLMDHTDSSGMPVPREGSTHSINFPDAFSRVSTTSPRTSNRLSHGAASVSGSVHLDAMQGLGQKSNKVTKKLKEKKESQLDLKMYKYSLRFVQPMFESAYLVCVEESQGLWSLPLIISVTSLIGLTFVDHSGKWQMEQFFAIAAAFTNLLLCIFIWIKTSFVKEHYLVFLRLLTGIFFVLGVYKHVLCIEFVSCYVTIAHMLNKALFLHSICMSAIIVIMAIVFTSVLKDNATYDFVQASILFGVYVVLSVGSYQNERNHRAAFSKSLAYTQSSQRSNELKKNVGIMMEQVYNMTMEKYDLTDTQEQETTHLESPAEMAVLKLQTLQKSETIGEEDFLEINKVIELLANASRMFRPDITSQSELEPETERWILDLVETVTDHRRDKAVAPRPAKQSIFNKPSILLSLSAESDELNNFLDGLDTWNFDVLHLLTLTNKPLLVIGMKLLQRYNLFKALNLDIEKTKTFLTRCEMGYKDLPYHNALHAADVIRSVHYFLQYRDIHTRFKRVEILSVLFSAIIHDLDHPGQNNAFFIATKHPKAILYNDRSVLENHHLATAFTMLKQEDANMMHSLSKPDYDEFRQLSVGLVLATDLKQHFETLAQYKLKISGGTVDMDDSSIRENVLKMAIKCADVGHSWKPLELHKKWTMKVMDEFFAQGDMEEKAGVTVSPFMDRDKTSIPGSQSGFFKFLVIPMYDSFIQSLDLIEDRPQLQSNAFSRPHVPMPTLKQLKRNLQYWKLLADTPSEEKEKHTHTKRNSLCSSPEVRKSVPAVSPKARPRSHSSGIDKPDFSLGANINNPAAARESIPEHDLKKMSNSLLTTPEAKTEETEDDKKGAQLKKSRPWPRMTATESIPEHNNPAAARESIPEQN